MSNASKIKVPGQPLNTPMLQYAIDYAQYAAQRRGLTHFDADHLILGIIHNSGSAAAFALAAAGVTPNRVRASIEEAWEAQPKVSGSNPTPSTRANVVLEMAYAFARNSGHRWTRQEHLLEAILHSGVSRHTALFGIPREATAQLWATIQERLEGVRKDLP